MEQVITYLSGHFLESLVLILIVALFFKEALMAWVRSQFGVGPTVTERKTLEMANDMTALKMHFNDETTHLLTDLQVMAAKNEETSQKILNNQTTMCTKLSDIHDTLRDMERNGIRIRR